MSQSLLESGMYYHLQQEWILITEHPAKRFRNPVATQTIRPITEVVNLGDHVLISVGAVVFFLGRCMRTKRGNISWTVCAEGWGRVCGSDVSGKGPAAGLKINPNPPRYLLYRVLEPLGPFLVGTWEVRVSMKACQL